MGDGPLEFTLSDALELFETYEAYDSYDQLVNPPVTKKRKGSSMGRLQFKKRFLANGNADGVLRHDWILFQADEQEFRRYMRMDRATFDFVKAGLSTHAYFQPPRARSGPRALSVNERLCIGLARMGTQGENFRVGNDFGRAGSTVRECVDRFAKAICDTFMDDFIKLPSEDECNEFMSDFMIKRGIPACIGAADGKHWVTCMGRDDPLAYKDFHGNYSLTMLGIVNSKYEFWYVSDFYAGATHDSRIWNSSTLFREIVNGTFPPSTLAPFTIFGNSLKPFIIVDSAFSGSDFLLKPLTQAKFNLWAASYYSHKYNKVQSSSRQVIEQAWGLVVNRFRIFKATSEIKGADWKTRFSTLILAGIILHNICMKKKDSKATRNSFQIDEFDRQEFEKTSRAAWLNADPAEQGLHETHDPDEVATVSNMETNLLSRLTSPNPLMVGRTPQEVIGDWCHRVYRWSDEHHGCTIEDDRLNVSTKIATLRRSTRPRHRDILAQLRVQLHTVVIDEH